MTTDNNATHHHARLTARPGIPLVLLLCAFMSLVCGSFIAVMVHNAENRKAEILLNVIGQQRMLIYKYSSEINYILLGLSNLDLEMVLKKKRGIDDIAVLFEKVHHALLYGDKVVFPENSHLGTVTIEKIEDTNTRHQLDDIYQQWQELKRIALLSLRSNSNSVTQDPYVGQLLDQANMTVNKINTFIQTILNNNNTEIRRLDILLFSTIVMGLLVLMIITHFVYTRFIQPLDRSVQELTDERDRAEKASQAKSEFLSHMSHELRTPLNALLGYTQLLDIDVREKKRIEPDYLDEMMHAGQHLLTLINEVLDLQKIESGNIEVTISPTNLEDLLTQCLTLISIQASRRQITVSDHVSGRGYVVLADSNRLKQVLLNMLSNAVKYNNDNGTINIEATAVDHQRLRISVTNSGAGLTSDEINRLFTPFERLNNPHNVDGTGIGLVIVKHLIERMNGRIGLDSIPGTSTTFWVELKLADTII